MKKLITIIAIASTLSLASAGIDSNLKYGMKSSEVSELQDFLTDKGFLTTSPSGFFGLLTLKAVKAYQSSESLPSSGFVGQMTRAKINESLLKDTLSSTEAEVQEVGTTTPVVITPPIVYYVPLPTTPAPVVVLVEDVYTLSITNLVDIQDANYYCGCIMSIGFTFTPVATLNGKPIEVISCTLPTLQLTEKFRKDYSNVAFHASSGDYPKRLGYNEAGIVSCTLVNGKVLSN
jgi:peptidoglycan hydrolase-like protein with peptidoglycan-binding domain